MGLDISVLKNAKLVRKGWPEDADWDTDGRQYIFALEGFEARLDGKPVGVYDGEWGHDFRAGSYSGYNHFRSVLASVGMEADRERIWNYPETYAGKPFFELVNFADNEGAIGPVTSKKLHTDFVENREKFQKYVGKHMQLADDAEYYMDRYDEWTKTFKEAAETDGFVVFH